MQKFIIISFCALALSLIYSASNTSSIQAKSANHELIYNSQTENFYFKGGTRYANQPLEKKMLALQAIVAN